LGVGVGMIVGVGWGVRVGGWVVGGLGGLGVGDGITVAGVHPTMNNETINNEQKTLIACSNPTETDLDNR